MKYYIKTFINVIIASLGAGLALTNPFLVAPGLAITYLGIKNANNGIVQNDIKNSCFEVIKNYKNKIAMAKCGVSYGK